MNGTDTEIACRNCFFGREGPNGWAAQTGQCVRYPPTVFLDWVEHPDIERADVGRKPVVQSARPPVHGIDWCGEFQPKGMMRKEAT